MAQQQQVEWKIRLMQLDDVEECLRLRSKLSVPEAHHMVASALKANPNSFYVAQLEPTGEIIGMCSSAITRQDTAIMGFYAVDSRFQGIGIGRSLWQHAIGQLGQSMNIGLYCKRHMVEKYQRGEFKLENPAKLLVYEKDAHKLNVDKLANIDDLSVAPEYLSGQKLAESTPVAALDCKLKLQVIDSETDEQMFEKFVEYDQSVNKFSREHFLTIYCKAKDAPLTLAVVCEFSPPIESNFREASAHDDAGESQPSRRIVVLGYGGMRLESSGYCLLGPIYADSSEICEVLVLNLISRCNSPSVRRFSWKMLGSNEKASELAQKVGFELDEEFTSLFTKFVPEATSQKIYAIQSACFTLF